MFGRFIVIMLEDSENAGGQVILMKVSVCVIYDDKATIS